MRPLSQLTYAAGRLSAIADRRTRVAVIRDLLPDLAELVEHPQVEDGTVQRIIMKMIRSLVPGHPIPASREALLPALRAVLDEEQAAGGRRGRGRPPIGPAVEVALSPETHTWLEEQMAEHGVAKKADMVRRLVVEAQNAARGEQR